jgi:glycerol-3-phosphate O-acyltransferase
LCHDSRLTLQAKPDQAYQGFYDLGEAIRPFLIRYYIVCILLDTSLPEMIDIEQAAASIYQKVFETLNRVPVETTSSVPFGQFLKILKHRDWVDPGGPLPRQDTLALQQALAGLLSPDIITAVTSCLNTLLHKNIESTTSTL